MGNKSRTAMPVSQRTKQFMPFLAVTGLEEALRKKETEIDAKSDIEINDIMDVNKKDKK